MIKTNKQTPVCPNMLAIFISVCNGQGCGWSGLMFRPPREGQKQGRVKNSSQIQGQKTHTKLDPKEIQRQSPEANDEAHFKGISTLSKDSTKEPYSQV